MTKVLPFQPAPQNVVRLPLGLIREELVHLRTEYAEEPLAELQASVETEGLLQPIVVAPADDGAYELVFGSRRLRVHRQKKSSDILAIVMEPKSPLNYILMALAENIHREPLDPFEEARTFLRLMKEYDLAVSEIASKIRKGTQYVTRRLQLVGLPEEVQTVIAKGDLAVDYVSTLSQLPSGEDQVAYARRAVQEDLTEPELRAVIKKETSEIKPRRKVESTISGGKVRARIEMFAEWLTSLPTATIARRLNSDERNSILSSLETLEQEVRTFRDTIEGGRSKKSQSHGNHAGPRNASEHWPAGDLKKITAEDRPSDEELARELGRTVSAIRGMRSKVTATKKRRRA